MFDTAFRRARRALYKKIKTEKPLYWMPMFPSAEPAYRFSTISTVSDLENRWRVCVLVIDETGLTLYPHSPQMDVKLHFPKSVWRWFGRPQKYGEQSKDVLWLHIEVGGHWQIIELRMGQHYMQKIIRAFKKIATPEQVTAYRRRRPYIHYGPVEAFAAEQDLYGVWTVFPEAWRLYVMPYALIIFDGSRVNRVIPLEQVQQIEALHRRDQPEADGLVRFKIGQGDAAESHAYTLSDFVGFGAALAEAAKRSLEDPLMFSKKKKDDDYEDEDE